VNVLRCDVLAAVRLAGIVVIIFGSVPEHLVDAAAAAVARNHGVGVPTIVFHLPSGAGALQLALTALAAIFLPHDLEDADGVGEGVEDHCG